MILLPFWNFMKGIKMTYPKAETWPSIELLFDDVNIRLPSELMERLAQRYAEHSGEYKTNEYDYDSDLPVNACMMKDNLKDIEEELVDAIFNALVFNFRYNRHLSYGGQIIDVLQAEWVYVKRIREDIAAIKAMS